MIEIQIDKNIMSTNDWIASEIKEIFHQKNIFCLNVMGSPGSGKTTLLEALTVDLQDEYKVGVIEGDMATTRDADRIAALGIQAVQISTVQYKSSCHMNAMMVKDALQQFDLDDLDIVIIENVGNLVCPAEYDIGEDKRLVVLSITEGEDKPLKYPVMFNRTNAVVVHKMDLAEALETDLEAIKANIRTMNPNCPLFYVSSRKKTGLEEVRVWLERELQEKSTD